MLNVNMILSTTCDAFLLLFTAKKEADFELFRNVVSKVIQGESGILILNMIGILFKTCD